MVQHMLPQRTKAAAASSENSSPGRIVVQAWLASRGLIFAVALVLAVVQHRTLSNMVSNSAIWPLADILPRLTAP